MARKSATKSADVRAPQKRDFASGDASLRISAADFVAWQDRLGLSNNAAARAIFASPNSIAIYRAMGAGPDVALRCRAVELGVSAGDSWQFIERAAKLLAQYRALHP
ncbi:hypothetical protein [Bradyrhizobium cenepequi]